MSEPSDREIKELYARFGLAYYESEVLHRGLCTLYAISPFRTGGETTRLRVEERYGYAWTTTLGQIVGEFNDEMLNKGLVERLGEAVQRRNFLAHRFWFQRVHLMFSQEGVQHLIKELEAAFFLFEELDGEIDARSREKMSRLGVETDQLREALERTKQGNDFEALHDQRSLNKQERIVAAYDAPADGNRQLVLETQDGELWTLSDVGIAWSKFQRPHDDWSRNEPLTEFLPATVNPRPQIDQPWHYKIQLRGNVFLQVWWTGDGRYGWSIVRDKA